ncbi:sce7726 family protein [Collimonas sp. H4R21]|uniref:Sce7726 family protein n=1 Tax=Collimonas rhizosphaerae TaxID=3126357 RepID=A0ABU9PQK9_9BURK
MNPIDEISSPLGDKDIRRSLIRKLSTQAPKAIIEELRVHNGNAIADVVTVHSEPHCYEIKGEGDNIQRILTQGKFYDLVFGKVTLVTTENHLAKALALAPEHWGIIVAKRAGQEVKLSHSRSAKKNPGFNKQLALLTLWRSELAEVAISVTDEKISKLTRACLSQIIAENLGQEKLMKNIGEKLIARSAKLENQDTYKSYAH